MTLLEWRQDKALVKSAYDLLYSKTGQQMMKLLDNEIRARRLTPKTGLQSTDHSYLLGITDGAEAARSALESMAELFVRPQSVPQNYQNEQ